MFGSGWEDHSIPVSLPGVWEAVTATSAHFLLRIGLLLLIAGALWLELTLSSEGISENAGCLVGKAVTHALEELASLQNMSQITAVVWGRYGGL